MNCDNCPHMERIREALKPCQKCDNGSHHGKSHVQATDFTLDKKLEEDPQAVSDEYDKLDAIEMRRLLADLLAKVEKERTPGSGFVILDNSDLDAIREFFEDDETRHSKQTAQHEATIPLRELPYVQRLVVLFRDLDLNTLEVLHVLLNGATYRNIAHRLGIHTGPDKSGRQVIQMRVKTACCKYPWMKAFFDQIRPFMICPARSHNKDRSSDWRMNEMQLTNRTRYTPRNMRLFHLPEIEGPEYGEHPGDPRTHPRKPI